MGKRPQTSQISKRSRRPGARNALLIFFVLGLIALIAVAYLLPKHDAGEEVRAILKEARDDRAKRAAAEAEARKAVPVDAAIPASWDFRPILKTLGEAELEPLVTLVNSYVICGDNIPDADVARIRKILARCGASHVGNPFYFIFTPESVWGPDLKARLSAFLRECKPLQEIETAYKLGLLQDVVDAYRNPLESNLVSLSVLFAGRALCELEAGETPRALETLLTGYGIAGLSNDWPHCYGTRNRFFSDRILHFVLWRYADAGTVGTADRQRITQALDALKPVDRLAKALLVQAANVETGEESDHRGYPKLIGYGFAITGRGALASARQLASLLNTPPYQVRQQVETLGEHRTGGYNVNRFIDNAVVVYRMHSRESMMGDAARLAFVLKDWRREHGAYPASLQEVQPFPLQNLPKEPLTGEPLKYESGGTSFILQTLSNDPLGGEIYWTARQ